MLLIDKHNASKFTPPIVNYYALLPIQFRCNLLLHNSVQLEHNIDENMIAH